MPKASFMMFDEGFDQEIRCRFISEWFKIDSHVSSKETLVSDIGRNKLYVVVIDLGLYAKMDWIETSRRIRNRFDVPVVYF